MAGRASSDRYERQFERVKRAEIARGKPEQQAEDIASRVVELRRQLEAESSSPPDRRPARQ
ncbi:MAG: hypothetical protein ACODAB_03490 [Gemmatimonadota bacterium]